MTVVVFDIDDTLYLERDYVRSGFVAVGAAVGERFGVTDFAERAWTAFLKGSRRTIFDDTLAACGVAADARLVGELVDRYRTHEPAISLLPDARSALDAAVAAGGVAVVTDGPLASQKAKAGALGLAGWADPLVFTEERGPDWGKPSPLAFALVEEALGVAGSDCTYVADNPAKDFAGPRSRGWRTIRVRRPLSLHAAVACGPDVDIEAPDLSGFAEVALQ